MLLSSTVYQNLPNLLLPYNGLPTISEGQETRSHQTFMTRILVHRSEKLDKCFFIHMYKKRVHIDA